MIPEQGPEQQGSQDEATVVASLADEASMKMFYDKDLLPDEAIALAIKDFEASGQTLENTNAIILQIKAELERRDKELDAQIEAQSKAEHPSDEELFHKAGSFLAEEEGNIEHALRRALAQHYSWIDREPKVQELLAKYHEMKNKKQD